jgi:methanogenic corrinoid protein MtbC1
MATQLQDRKYVIAKQTLAERMKLSTNRDGSFSGKNKEKFLKDCEYHIDFLCPALAYNSPGIFADYITWVRNLFANLSITEENFRDYFATFTDVIVDQVDQDGVYGLRAFIESALAQFNEPFQPIPSYISAATHLSHEAKTVLDSLLLGKQAFATKYVMDLVAGGVSIQDCYLEIIQPVQQEVGRLWHNSEISVGMEHYVTSASQVIMSQFYPSIMNHDKTGKSLLTACISGEQHELGLRMVADLMELEGWDTYFLGSNTPLFTIPQLAISKKVNLLAISVTLSTHLEKLEQLISMCREEIPQLKIMVGGYPFNVDRNLWQKMGADGYGTNAMDAINVAEQLVK